MKDIFLLVDGNSLMHRAFHALPLMDADGVYTNAVYGFLSMLLKVVKEENVQYLAVCFDEHGPTFRHTVYADYKAGRRETPPELRQQFGTILSLLDEMGIRRFSLQGWEADDLLGTLSLKGAAAGAAPLLLTGDRDALQLVGGGTELMFTRKGISETIRFTPAKVYEEYGFTPEQVTDWKGLAGDASDNIPGVPGVGDKTAVKLLQEYGTLEEVLANAGKVKGKLGEKLGAFAEQARFSKELATIRRDAPVDFSLSDCALPDLRKGIPALEKLKLNSIIRRLGSGEEAEGDTRKTAVVRPETGPADVLGSGTEIAAWLEETKQHGPLCVYLSDRSVSLAREGGKTAEIGLGGDLLNPGPDPAEVLENLLKELEHGDGIVHNGKALLHLFDRYGLKTPERFGWDTMLAAYLLNPQEKSYRLGALCPDLPEDAATLCALAAWQKARVEGDGMMKLMREVEQPLSFVLFRMEQAGFTVDTDFLRDLGARYTAEIGEKRDRVIEAAGHPFNLNSTQQLGEVLFDEMNLPHGKKTSKGYSTSVEVLEGLRFDAPEIIEPLLRYRQLTKLNSTLPPADQAEQHLCGRAAAAGGRKGPGAFHLRPDRYGHRAHFLLGAEPAEYSGADGGRP